MDIYRFFRVACCVFFVGLYARLHAEETNGNHDKGRFIFLPQGRTFESLVASYQEPRVGLRKEIGTSRMKLDIGNMLDVLEFRPATGQSVRIGIEFFTFALTTSSQGLRLQVDAVDGFFGGHIVYRWKLEESALALRLRLLHLSAHFLDGHFNESTQSWKDGRGPVPFTKDFGELLAAYDFTFSKYSMRVYSGFSYATLIRPVVIKRIATLHGLEIHTSDIAGPLFGKPLNIYLADNLTLVGIPAYVGTNNVEFGLKFGEWNSSGIKVYLSFYSGLEPFSQYYDVRRRGWGLGFAFDFW